MMQLFVQMSKELNLKAYGLSEKLHISKLQTPKHVLCFCLVSQSPKTSSVFGGRTIQPEQHCRASTHSVLDSPLRKHPMAGKMTRAHLDKWGNNFSWISIKYKLQAHSLFLSHSYPVKV